MDYFFQTSMNKNFAFKTDLAIYCKSGLQDNFKLAIDIAQAINNGYIVAESARIILLSKYGRSIFDKHISDDVIKEVDILAKKDSTASISISLLDQFSVANNTIGKIRIKTNIPIRDWGTDIHIWNISESSYIKANSPNNPKVELPKTTVYLQSNFNSSAKHDQFSVILFEHLRQSVMQDSVMYANISAREIKWMDHADPTVIRFPGASINHTIIRTNSDDPQNIGWSQISGNAFVRYCSLEMNYPEWVVFLNENHLRQISEDTLTQVKNLVYQFEQINLRGGALIRLTEKPSQVTQSLVREFARLVAPLQHVDRKPY